ncbi:MAG: sulfite exporter TauE/SafE family protein [Patescibacteria group bacterium]|nr:sulfite exporter TauE/SafE family protein [Patescibacteria group bacterium]
MIHKIIKIKGMHCRSCEILIEDKLKEVKEIKRVVVSYRYKNAEIYSSTPIAEKIIGQKIEEAGYEIGNDNKHWLTRDPEKYKDIALSFVWIAILYFIVKILGLFNINVGSVSKPDNIFIVLLIGLTAGFSSCMALVGGLVLGISAKHAEKHPEATPIQKFRPHLFFNLGRILSYFILGGLIGLIGKAFQFSGPTLGILTIIVGLVMLTVGLQLTELFPRLQNFSFTLPPFLAKWLGIKKHHEKEYSHINSIIVGALTFFLPCGFTQAMQLYAMSTGNFWQGAIIMGLFALGTAPGLLGIGGLTSVLKGQKARRFFKFLNWIVVFLALFNLSNGLNLLGVNIKLPSLGSNKNNAVIPNSVTQENGVQTIKMNQVSNGYQPNSFTIKKNIPVKWIINSLDPNSCASSFYVPKLNIRKFLQPGENIFEFTPTEVSTINFSCSMGMYRGSINVIDSNVTPANNESIVSPTPTPSQSPDINSQVIKAIYTYKNDIEPKEFTVKAGQPVRMEIEAKDDGKGCMGSVAIPKLVENFEYFEKGKTIVFNFTVPKPGTYYITCGMGSPRGKIIAN